MSELHERFLIEQEGLSLKPYRDHLGILTIGVGRNLDHRGISREEALFMLRRDCAEAEASARHLVAEFEALSPARKTVLVSMVFQLGPRGVAGFRRMLAALNEGDYEQAAKEMLASRWAEQTPRRARLQAEMMRMGEML